MAHTPTIGPALVSPRAAASAHPSGPPAMPAIRTSRAPLTAVVLPHSATHCLTAHMTAARHTPYERLAPPHTPIHLLCALVLDLTRVCATRTHSRLACGYTCATMGCAAAHANRGAGSVGPESQPTAARTPPLACLDLPPCSASHRLASHTECACRSRLADAARAATPPQRRPTNRSRRPHRTPRSRRRTRRSCTARAPTTPPAPPPRRSRSGRRHLQRPA